MSWPYRHEPGNPESLGGDNVLALSPDNNGCLWLATYGDGLSMYNPVTKKFKNYKSENYPGLASNYIFSLLPGDDNSLWLATKEGPVRFNLKTSVFETIPMDGADTQRRSIVSLLKDKEGNIWAGTQKESCAFKRGIIRLVSFPDFMITSASNPLLRMRTGNCISAATNA
ncbi:two-component regulator propeller domain-containing protein [Bacteroides sp. CR5/BHMF/2]|nr:two-component regulator propeller domain-containing protein [Bacteroides sp. CR5/BHMF/2]